MVDVPIEILENTFLDWKKKDINPVDRAMLLKKYREEKGIGQRELARELDVPHSTLGDLEMYGRFSKEEYAELENKGLSKKEIYKLVRNNKQTDKNKILAKTEAELRLESLLYEVDRLCLTNDYRRENLDLIKVLKREVDRLEKHIQNVIKK